MWPPTARVTLIALARYPPLSALVSPMAGTGTRLALSAVRILPEVPGLDPGSEWASDAERRIGGASSGFRDVKRGSLHRGANEHVTADGGAVALVEGWATSLALLDQWLEFGALIVAISSTRVISDSRRKKPQG